MRLFALFVISPQLVVFLAAFLCAEVSIVSCCVPACAPSWCFSSRLLVRSFSPQGFLLFSSLLVFLLVLSFSLLVSRFSPQGFLLGGCISCVVDLRFSQQGFLQFRFASFLLSIWLALAWICASLVVVSFFSLPGFLLSNCFVVFQWCSHQFWGVLGSFAVQSAVTVCFRGALIWISAPVSVLQHSISHLWGEIVFLV